MSTELSSSNAAQSTIKSRKQITKLLSTGQKISLSTQDERMLRSVYEYLAGFASRRAIETAVESKRADVNRLHNALPPSSRLQLQMNPRSLHFASEKAEQMQSNAEDSATNPNKTETDLLLDEYYQTKEDLHKLEEKLKIHSAVDHKIGFKDLDAVLRSLGPPFSKKQIEVNQSNSVKFF
jgi:hypothetical protein